MVPVILWFIGWLIGGCPDVAAFGPWNGWGISLLFLAYLGLWSPIVAGNNAITKRLNQAFAGPQIRRK